MSSTVHASSTDSGVTALPQRHAQAFTGSKPPMTTIEAKVRLRGDDERASFTASGVPQTRAKQILASVLALRGLQNIEPSYLRIDIYRADQWKYENNYGLAVAMALLASMTKQPIAPSVLFVGDVDLQGRVRDVTPKLVDRLNRAVNRFQLELPVTIVAAPDSAAWVNASPNVQVIPATILADAARAVWPALAKHF